MSSVVPGFGMTNQRLSIADLQEKCLEVLKETEIRRNGIVWSELARRVNVHRDDEFSLQTSISSNPVVRIEMERFFYKTKYPDVQDRAALERMLTNNPGTPYTWKSLYDLYNGAEADLCDMVRIGWVICIVGHTDTGDIIYYREPMSKFMKSSKNTFPLECRCRVEKGSNIVRTSTDLSALIFRNDLVFLNGEPYRVSSEILPYTRKGMEEEPRDRIEHDGTGVFQESKGNFMFETGGKYSVSDTAPHLLLHPRKYAHLFNEKQFPIDRPWAGESSDDVRIERMGTVGVLRMLWRGVVTHARGETVRVANNTVNGIVQTRTKFDSGVSLLSNPSVAAIAETMASSTDMSSIGSVGTKRFRISLPSTAGVPTPSPNVNSEEEASTEVEIEEGTTTVLSVSAAEKKGDREASMFSLVSEESFQGEPDFPSDHRSLYEVMRSLNMETRMTKDTLVASVEGTAKPRRLNRNRALDSRHFAGDYTNLNAATREAVIAAKTSNLTAKVDASKRRQ